MKDKIYSIYQNPTKVSPVFSFSIAGKNTHYQKPVLWNSLKLDLVNESKTETKRNSFEFVVISQLPN